MDLPVERPVTATEGRLVSLDALRGFDMFWIVGGHAIATGLGKSLNSEWFNRHILPQIQHVPWEGFTAWDLIMPLFLFMVGAAMPFSFAKRLAQGESKGRLFLHVLYRVVILWVLGMIAQGRLLEYDISQLQLYSNTLQAIAAGYLIASILLLTLRPTVAIHRDGRTAAGLLGTADARAGPRVRRRTTDPRKEPGHLHRQAASSAGSRTGRPTPGF